MDRYTDEELLNEGYLDSVTELARRSYNENKIIDKNKFNSIYTWEFYLGAYLGYVSLTPPNNYTTNTINKLKKIITDEDIDVGYNSTFYDGFRYHLINIIKIPDRRLLLNTLSFLIDRNLTSKTSPHSMMRMIIDTLKTRYIYDRSTNNRIFIKDDELILQLMKENVRKYTLDEVIYQINDVSDEIAGHVEPIVLEGIINYYGVNVGRLRDAIPNSSVSNKRQILKWLDDAILGQV